MAVLPDDRSARRRPLGAVVAATTLLIAAATAAMPGPLATPAAAQGKRATLLTGTLSSVPVEPAHHHGKPKRSNARPYDAEPERYVLRTERRTHVLTDPQNPQLLGRTVQIRDRNTRRAHIQGRVRLAPVGRRASSDVKARTRTLAVVRVVFEAGAADPASPAVVAQKFHGPGGTNPLYAEQSDGRLQFKGKAGGSVDVFPRSGATVNDPAVITRPGGTTCGSSFYYGVESAVRGVMGTAEFNSYDHVMVAFPKVAACGWAGLGHISGPFSWINGTFGASYGVSVIAHELGHNLGAGHGGKADGCTTRSGGLVTLTSTRCDYDDYGEANYNLMGGGISNPALMASWHRMLTGQLDSARTGAIPGPGAYPLHNLNVPRTSGHQMLGLHRPDGSQLSFELRIGSGVFDSWSILSPQSSGLMVRVADASTPGYTGLLDMAPATGTLGDAPLVPGAVLRDALSGYYFKINPFTGDSATLLVSRNADFSDIPGDPAGDPGGGGSGSDPGDAGTPGDSGGPGVQPPDPPQPPTTPSTDTPGPSDSGSLPLPRAPYVPDSPRPADDEDSGMPAPARSVTLSSPRLRRGTAKLPRNRRIRVQARGAGKLVITSGKRRLSTDSASATFKLTKAQSRRATITVVASRGQLKRSLRLELRVRNGKVTVRR